MDLTSRLKKQQIKEQLVKLIYIMGLPKDFSGELRINYHKGDPSEKIKKMECAGF